MVLFAARLFFALGLSALMFVGAFVSAAKAQVRLVGDVEVIYHESDAHACPPGTPACANDPFQSVVATRTRLGFEAVHELSADIRAYGRGSLVGVAFAGADQKELGGLTDLALGVVAGPIFIEGGQVGDNRGARILPPDIDQLYLSWPSHPIEDFQRIETQRVSVGVEVDDWGVSALMDDDGQWLLLGNVTLKDAGWFYKDLFVGATIGQDMIAASADWSDDNGSLFLNYIYGNDLGHKAWRVQRSMQQATIGVRQRLGGAEVLASYAKQYFNGADGGDFWFDVVRGGLEYDVAPGLSLIAVADKQWHSEPSGQFAYQVHNYHAGFKVSF